MLLLESFLKLILNFILKYIFEGVFSVKDSFSISCDMFLFLCLV